MRFLRGSSSQVRRAAMDRRTCVAAFYLPDPALAQALHVPVGHSDSEAVRTSRPPGHAPALLEWRTGKKQRLLLSCFKLMSATQNHFGSVPMWIFFQRFHQQILHALIRLAEETVVSVARR